MYSVTGPRECLYCGKKTVYIHCSSPITSGRTVYYASCPECGTATQKYGSLTAEDSYMDHIRKSLSRKEADRERKSSR